MDVKEAFDIAIKHITSLFSNISNTGLEEVSYDEEKKEWLITVGFSRPWDYEEENPFSNLNVGSLYSNKPKPRPIREYKVVTINAETKEVKSIKIREVN